LQQQADQQASNGKPKRLLPVGSGIFEGIGVVGGY
jgi:hypothetical protein